MSRRTVYCALWLCVALLFGCEGVIQSADNEVSSVPTSATDPLHKRWLEDTAGENPLRRMTMDQLRYSIVDLTGVQVKESLLPHEAHRDGFTSFAALQVSSTNQVRAFGEVAKAVADQVPLSELVDCTTYDRPCAERLLQGFGRSAFRGPLSTEETTRYLAVYDAALPFGEEQAMRWVVRALLSAPQFLYRTHAFGERAGKTGYAVAEKLSFFLWSSVPDEALLQAAEAGELDDAAGRRAAAMRMLADPKAKRTVDAFHAQWLRLDELAHLAPDPATFPEYSDALSPAYEKETLHFARDVFFGSGGTGGTLTELLTAPKAYVNDDLASLYGYAGGSSNYEATDVGEEPRAGVLMQGGFLARLSTLKRSEPIYRGAFILKQVLCRELELPGDLNVMLPEPDPELTYRQQLEELTSPDFCYACHSRINPLGFAMDDFDALGRYRPVEGDEPVDTSVEMVGLGKIDGSYSNAPELLQSIAESDMARECYAEKWYEFAMGRARHPDRDTAVFKDIETRFEAQGFNLQALVLAIVESPAF